VVVAVEQMFRVVVVQVDTVILWLVKQLVVVEVLN
jgi:hypothetical protein